MVMGADYPRGGAANLRQPQCPKWPEGIVGIIYHALRYEKAGRQ
jgi:hypothetical protein